MMVTEKFTCPSLVAPTAATCNETLRECIQDGAAPASGKLFFPVELSCAYSHCCCSLTIAGTLC